METVKVKKSEVEEVIRLLRKYEESNDSDFYSLALNSIRPVGYYKICNVNIVTMIDTCMSRFGYYSKGIIARVYSLLSFYGIDVEE